MAVKQESRVEELLAAAREVLTDEPGGHHATYNANCCSCEALARLDNAVKAFDDKHIPPSS